MAKRGTQFQTIRTEGAILPPDILRRIASLKVDGATPDAYHLPPGSKLNEAISQSWTSLLNHWQAFQEARANLPESDLSGTAVTNERWLLPLFKELDYGRLVTSKSPEIDERVYPIERFYNHTPIHLIGCKLPLDRRTSGARGAATASPHSMVQEFINRSDDHLWAFLSNGLQLRILRDNISLSRQAFVEFDLEAMMDGEVYADFALLWLLCHQSRVESDKAVDCWLEKWSHLAREQGTRVLNDLRVGVKKSIEALGRGFIGHPRNDQLREKLRTGSLSTDEFYRQLLRTVYRLLFLFVAEDRELLHPPDADSEACNLYDTHYSTRRLREVAHKIRGSKHSDLWHSLSLVFDALGRNEGCPELGLCGLGSFLWRSSSTADLVGPLQANGQSKEDSSALITNDDLLQAVRALAYVEQDRVLRIVDYRNLGSEELGSVYESLLELHPVMNADSKAFELSTAAGNERKTTGSYYTPDSLVQCLLDSALDPVVEDRLKGKKGNEAVEALLGMKVCDPACGSGHFLIAAAHRLARHLARVRTGEAEPTPVDYQHALRDVIGRCVYGVDVNPMAVELCKVSLWMEAIEPGKPLSFLDHHIQCGNSLLGTTPALLAKGIPDDAFKPVEGDVKERVNALKKDNKRERQDYKSGQGYLFSPTLKLGNMPATISQINSASEETVEDVAAKQEMYEKLVKGADYLTARLLADTWCAAFVWAKDDTDLGRLCPTERNFRSTEENPHSTNVHVKAEVRRLAGVYQFFHWHLGFPDVFRLPAQGDAAENGETHWNGGFDIVLGNPPWERTSFEDIQFFGNLCPDISNAPTTSERRRRIAQLADSNPELLAEYHVARQVNAGLQHLIDASQLFKFTAVGRVDTYALFTELANVLTRCNGMAGLVVPTGIATAIPLGRFWNELFSKGRVRSLCDFENRDQYFPGVDTRKKFCLLTICGPAVATEQTLFGFFLPAATPTGISDNTFYITPDDMRRVNPTTGQPPVVPSRNDLLLLLLIHRNSSSNLEDTPGWVGYTSAGTGDSWVPFSKTIDGLNQDTEYCPLVEAKMLYQFDHRFATYEGCNESEFDKGQPASSDKRREQSTFVTTPRFLVPRLPACSFRERKSPYHTVLAVYRDYTSATNERTLICALLPNGVPMQPLNGFSCRSANDTLSAIARLNSFIVDFAARLKTPDIHLNVTIFDQLPGAPIVLKHEDVQWFGALLTSATLELTFTSWDLEAFALDCGYAGPPFRWNEERRYLLRCELDAAYFHLYLGSKEDWGSKNRELREVFPTPRDAIDYIMESFPIVKRKDIARTANENGENGRYITKDTILEIYDEMAEAIRTGQPYQTRFEKLGWPPPGPPTDAEGNFIPMAQWDPNNWPSHIHPPREKGKP